MLEVLNLCIQVEETIGRVYRWLAANAEDNPELRRIWAKMAMDEDGHADNLRFARRMNPLEHIAKTRIDRADVKLLLDKATRFHQLVQDGGWTEDAALKMACELEQNFQQVHIQMAAEFTNGQMREMFNNLGKGDREHLAELEGYLAREKKDSPSGDSDRPQ